MKSAVTVSLVPEAKGGPFVFWDDLPEACRTAKALGFDAIELFAPGPDAVPARELQTILGDNGLTLATLGTGAGWLKWKLSLTSPDAGIRRRAVQFIRSMIEYGAAVSGAPVIIGSMQGRWGDGIDHPSALQFLRDGIFELAECAPRTHILYEPLNRYESNLANRLEQGLKVLAAVRRPNVGLLADLFHMNIEEMDLAEAILHAGDAIDHVHLADSNRQPAGFGHTDFAPIGAALRQIGYQGYISAEAFPYPESRSAAEATMQAFRTHFLATGNPS